MYVFRSVVAAVLVGSLSTAAVAVAEEGEEALTTEPTLTSSTIDRQAEDLEREENPVVREARKLAMTGARNDAIELLETWLVAHPDDARARALLLDWRIAERKAELEATVRARVDESDYILGDPVYEGAKLKSPMMISRQLDWVEHLLQAQRYEEAVELLEQIRLGFPENEAVQILLDRTLRYLVKAERRQLERARAVRNGEVINDVLKAGTMPRRPKPIPRRVIIFDEDLAAAEREALLNQLKIRVKKLMYEKQPLEAVLKQLFAIAGMNFIILDSALASETFTIDVIDESVEHILQIIQRSVNVQFNYQGGSVYVTSGDNPILVTEIIRLRSGLSDVLKEPDLPELGGGGGGGPGGPGGGGAGGGGMPDPFGGGDSGGEADSDIERLLEEALGAEGLVDWPEGSKYYLDKKMNTLVVRSSPAAISEIKRIIDAIDRPAQQVLIEAKFVEVRANAMEEFGIRWQVLGDNDPNNPQNLIMYGGDSGGAPSPLGATPGDFAGILGQNTNGLLLGVVGTGRGVVPNFSATLRALEERNDANILSEPKILTLNNAWGVLSLTQEFAVITGFNNRSTGRQLPVVGDDNNLNSNQTIGQNALEPEYETEESGIQLRVRPSVSINDDIITMNLAPVVRVFLGYGQAGNTTPPVPQITSGGGGDDNRGTVVLGGTEPPLFAERRIFSSLNVRNGDTVVLGGLIEEDDSSGMEGVPGLNRIPGLGRLFRVDSESLRRSKLLIFITVHIIDPTGAEWSEEVRHLRNRARMALPSAIKEEARAREQAEAEAAAARAAARQEAESRSRSDEGSPALRKSRGRKP